MFDIPHRVLAVASYTTPKYGNGRFATNISLTYNGNSGQHYSLTMKEEADFNGDSQKGNTLLPRRTEESILSAMQQQLHGRTASTYTLQKASSI